VINPLRSEQEAFRFTLIVAVLVAPIVLAAIIWDSGVALGVAGGLVVGLLFAFLIRREDRRPRRVDLRRRDTGDGTARILVVANETLTGAARALRADMTTRRSPRGRGPVGCQKYAWAVAAAMH
jgi:hypothetical protein